MLVKASNGVYRQGIVGVEPSIGAQGPAGTSREKRPSDPKHLVDLARRAGRWIVYEETAYNFSINVIEDMRRFHSVTSKRDVFRMFDEWAAIDDVRRQRRLDRGY